MCQTLANYTIYAKNSSDYTNLLELEPTKRYLSIISNIRYLQRLLGDIHDSDIFIWYIQKHGLKIDSVTDIILQEKNKRDKTYAEMISYIKPLMHLG